MDGPCYGNGEDYNRAWIEKHEKEVRLLVHRYETGQEEVDLVAVRAWFDRPRGGVWVSALDNYCPPKVQAAMLYQSGAHKMSLIEFLLKGRSNESST